MQAWSIAGDAERIEEQIDDQIDQVADRVAKEAEPRAAELSDKYALVPMCSRQNSWPTIY